MLRITIELVPHGDESEAKIIGWGTIANTGTGTKTMGNYLAILSVDHFGEERHAISRVHDFKRLDRNVWDLLKVALNNCEVKDD